MSAPTGYTRLQIVLHWVVAILVAQQYVFNGAIGASWAAFKAGGTTLFNPLVAAHVFGGILILALVFARLFARFTFGAPALSKDEHPALRAVAHVTHWSLYVLLIGLAGTGLATWFGKLPQAASVHSLLKTGLMALIILHAAGALFQHFYIQSDSLMRMIKARH